MDRNFKLRQMFSDYMELKSRGSIATPPPAFPPDMLLSNLTDEDKKRAQCKKITEEEAEILDFADKSCPVATIEPSFELKWYNKIDQTAQSSRHNTEEDTLKLAQRLLQLLLKTEMLESVAAYKYDDVRMIRVFFMDDREVPSERLVAILDNIFTVSMIKLGQFSDKLAVAVDYQLRTFMADTMKAKRLVLETMLKYPEYIPDSWGGETAMVRWKVAKEADVRRREADEKDREKEKAMEKDAETEREETKKKEEAKRKEERIRKEVEEAERKKKEEKEKRRKEAAEQKKKDEKRKEEEEAKTKMEKKKAEDAAAAAAAAATASALAKKKEKEKKLEEKRKTNKGIRKSTNLSKTRENSKETTLELPATTPMPPAGAPAQVNQTVKRAKKPQPPTPAVTASKEPSADPKPSTGSANGGQPAKNSGVPTPKALLTALNVKIKKAI